MICGDGGKWLRRQCLILAQSGAAPVSYWESIPLWDLGEWIKAHNELVQEQRQKRDAERKKR